MAVPRWLSLLFVVGFGVTGAESVGSSSSGLLASICTRSHQQQPPTPGYVGVYSSADGGRSWSSSSCSLPDEIVVAAAASQADGSLWLASMTGRLLRSDDGGKSFANPFNATGDHCGNGLGFSTIAFAGAGGAGWVGCTGSTAGYRTVDGGKSWVAADIGMDGSTDNVVRVAFINETHGVGVSATTAWYTTTTAGEAWTRHVWAAPSNFSEAAFGKSGPFVRDGADEEAPLALLSGRLAQGSEPRVSQFVIEAFGRVGDFVAPVGHTDVSQYITTRGKAVLGAPPQLVANTDEDHCAYDDGTDPYVTVGGGAAVDGPVNGVHLSADSMFVLASGGIFRADRPRAGDPSPRVTWTQVLDSGDCEMYSMVELS